MEKKYEINVPVVSVIMPAYNAEKTIAAAIRSVQAQSMADWELLVVDDGSRDGTCTIVEAIAAEDSRVIFLRNEVNLGAAGTRNRAMELARGQFVALLDSDDYWRPGKLEKQLAHLRQTGADLCYTAYTVVGEDGEPYGDYPVPETTDFSAMLGENCIGCSTVLMTAELAKAYRFTTEFYHEDYVMWLQMLRDGKKAVGAGEVLVDYTYRPDSRAGNKVASAKYRWRIYRDYLKLPWGKSVCCLGKYALAGLKKYRRKG